MKPLSPPWLAWLALFFPVFLVFLVLVERPRLLPEVEALLLARVERDRDFDAALLVVVRERVRDVVRLAAALRRGAVSFVPEDPWPPVPAAAQVGVAELVAAVAVVLSATVDVCWLDAGPTWLAGCDCVCSCDFCCCC